MEPVPQRITSPSGATDTARPNVPKPHAKPPRRHEVVSRRDAGNAEVNPSSSGCSHPGGWVCHGVHSQQRSRSATRPTSKSAKRAGHRECPNRHSAYWLMPVRWTVWLALIRSCTISPMRMLSSYQSAIPAFPGASGWPRHPTIHQHPGSVRNRSRLERQIVAPSLCASPRRTQCTLESTSHP